MLVPFLRKNEFSNLSKKTVMANLGSRLTFSRFWVPKVPRVGVFGALLVPFMEPLAVLVT